MSYRINRRQALKGMGVASLLPLAGCGLQDTKSGMVAPDGTFAQGVASGDPDQSSVVLWTRVNQVEQDTDIAWELAETPEFTRILRHGVAAAESARDFTIKVLADGLAPGKQYFYRFRLGSTLSPLGRTRTLPVGKVDSVGFAIASCSNYPFGYFNAYEAIAKDDAVQFVLHLGDYIYEYGPQGYGGRTGETLGRQHSPSKEIVTLADYRERHRQYKSDLQSQSMHAAHPLIAIWDDHEVTNNPWMHGAENHQPEKEGDWVTRRNAAVQAYYEWMPVREPRLYGKSASTAALRDFWRQYRFGDLATLVTLETRHTGRSEQIEYRDHLASLGNRDEAQRFLREVVGAKDRSMISASMERMLRTTLARSVADGQPWRLLGNPIPMARTHAPALDHPYFRQLIDDPQNPVAEDLNNFKRLGELDLPIYLDPWDGYPAAREALYALAAGVGARDLLVLTGDSHSFWQNSLYDERGVSMGLELGTSGITSPGDFLAFEGEGAALVDQLLAEKNHEVEWTDGRHNGYVRLVLNPADAEVDYVAVSSVASPEYTLEVIRSLRIEHEQQTLRYSR